MRKLNLAFVIFSLLGPFGYAGTEQFSGKDMKEVAPITSPPACPNWTGFYVGAFGGYKFSATDVDLNLGGSWLGPSQTDPFDKDAIESTAPTDVDASGAEAGGLIGYNYQWRNWVLGMEAAGGYLWLRNSDFTDVLVVPRTGDDYSLGTSLKTHYLVTVAPRIGYSFCRWLPYVTGGLAIGDIDFSQRLVQHNVFFHETASQSDTQVGWMVGGGLEYAITDHWRARAQYQYIDLGCVGADSIGTAPFETYTGQHSACLHEHNASFAIIYGF
jgi:outer membrane immunogenic protein